MLQLFSRNATQRPTDSKGAPPPVFEPDLFDHAERVLLDSDPLNQCVQLERLGHLLANSAKWKGHPKLEEVCRSTRERIDDTFAIVPEGFASLPQTVNDYPGCPEVAIDTEPFLLARYAITNEQFQKFVDAGGYEELTLWPKDVWPHLIDFKDLTGRTGPRYWRDGRHSRRLATHPVVGVCYYEAAAYARWAGFRLPTEAEWQMTATWQIRSEANVLRRYPWGDALDTKRCNIWASGIGHTTPVHMYENGATPNQVYQLVGNIWEWTACEFNVTDNSGNTIVGDMRMSAIRGGAFDTYFPAQAAGVFRTGLVNLARAHNVGFRCATDLCQKLTVPAVVESSDLPN